MRQLTGAMSGIRNDPIAIHYANDAKVSATHGKIEYCGSALPIDGISPPVKSESQFPKPGAKVSDLSHLERCGGDGWGP